MRHVQTQMHQGDQHPVEEHQLMLRASPGGPLTPAPAPLVTRGLTPRRPRLGQLLDQSR
jgi:hypothetical protein